MNTVSLRLSLTSASLRALAVLAACWMTAGAAQADIDGVAQRGVLNAGLAYPLPKYVAGAKFRTPESLETPLAQDLATRLKAGLATVKADAGSALNLLKSGKADVVLAMVDDNDPLRRDAAVIATGYSAGAMAIMRTDTDIKTWEQLKGRTVCLSEGGAYVGKMAARYGAIEKVQRAPADSLLAVRIGECDAAVHDDTLLNELLKLPEWKKFSARLPVQSRAALSFIVRQDDGKAIAFLKQTAASWYATGFMGTLKKKWTNNVAFEVYLDQNVPDCH
ncbi:transporter substrate-binding domain-containing protein [Herbaspirillum autotrophicum]|uniref:transporter substrate-binding domain-containing protein n=1 Tax=Herbaspirillum autotrophicum TaxID=180195 RepID=UPI0009F9C0D8|nr:transporter substrate-binding domain-containing protein [Herbaspirillum autotrophicum]